MQKSQSLSTETSRESLLAPVLAILHAQTRVKCEFTLLFVSVLISKLHFLLHAHITDCHKLIKYSDNLKINPLCNVSN